MWKTNKLQYLKVFCHYKLNIKMKICLVPILYTIIVFIYFPFIRPTSKALD